MTAFIYKIRLIPIVLIAAACLFALKLTGIVLNGGYTLGAGHQAKSDRAIREAPPVMTRVRDSAAPTETPARKSSWAQDMFGYPDVTGSVGAAKPANEQKPAEQASTEQKSDQKTAQKPASAPPPPPMGRVIQAEAAPMSPAERALLERLSERRQLLEQRESELAMRDTLLKEAEKRLEERLAEIKEAEERIVAAKQQKEEASQERLKNLITMYENMKPKDAAKIFDRLDVTLATDVAKQIQPRLMSEILAQMTPESAQRLTVQLAAGARPAKPQPVELPKIEGRPGGM